MDIRIGMMNTGRELTFASDETPEAITTRIDEAIENAKTLSFTDVKGRTYVVPASALAFVEIGSEEARRVGFVA
ncbi:DUF3107 domain-containing protein [Microbacterium sp. G2-8]|uniref:DUF3107 domain-containing protein n=1 Tax=Microbacterium sp. G2-8 TaxID=2842454 RepID=UPI001C8967C8|nr:DUF3107 domain-containing protein [Microbacterium sp. G2-8]